MNKQQTDKVTARASRHFFISPEIWIPLLLLVLITLSVWAFDLDLRIQHRVHSEAGGWYLSKQALVRLMYNYGTIPALVVAGSALIVFLSGFVKTRYRRWRRISLYLVLVMALGPGLIVNTLLKDQWGRPRPRNVVQFGGKYQYEFPLQIDPSSPGKSFPSGHASMAFFFFAPALLLRRMGRSNYYTALGLTLGYGALMGYARIVQGGHYLSDVIWAGAIVWFVSYALYRIMALDKISGLDDPAVFPGAEQDKK